MSLAPGARLGRYEIVAPLGAGGMGEVYRARDPRLGRDVAIKSLPAAFAQDPERRSRFESEAKAIAALSHPNVLALYDVGYEDGTAFAVMELVEGQTLRERLMDGPLSSARAISIAVQIAHGLGAAHDRGVIHRDLKPENVVIAPDGRAKILDFGLAKRESPPVAGSQSIAPTVVSTEPGMVLGTIGYMSPEQVRGQVADARSDLFALGVVIHEMLSGRRAFHAESPADTMTAILREDPPDLAVLVPGVSPALERIVRRCLDKLPANRFRSAADLAFALEGVSSIDSSGGHASLPSSAHRLAARHSFQRLTYRNGHVCAAKFTPDGASVVYGASWEGRQYEIFSSRPGSPESRSLGLPAGSLLSMSSTGEMAVSMGYHHRYWLQVSGTLARVSLAGGGVRPLQKGVGDADWSPDGKTMAVIRYREGRCCLEYPAGHLLFDTVDWLSHCSVSRDGRHVAFARFNTQGDVRGDICIADTAGNPRVLYPNATNISGIGWSPSGDSLWWSGIDEHQRHGIWALTLDGARREVYASPIRVALLDVATDGRVLLTLGDIRIGLKVGGDDVARDVDLSWFDGSIACDFSADGRQVMLSEVDEAENPHYACYLREIDGSPAVRLGEGFGTRMSADGEWVLAIRSRPPYSLTMVPTGFGEPRPISFEGLDSVHWAGFHPDGRHVFVMGSAGERKNRIYLLPISKGEPRLLWDEEVEIDWVAGPPVSPDGNRLVLSRLRGERVLFSCDSGTAEPLRLEAIETALRFDASGRFLFVAEGTAGNRRIQRLELASGERTPWRNLEPPDPTGILYVSNPIVTSDGSRYAYSFLRLVNSLYLAEGLE